MINLKIIIYASAILFTKYIFDFNFTQSNYRCVSDESPLSCAKPKVLKYLSDATEQERLPITEDLSIIRSRYIPEDNFDEYYASQDTVDPNRKEQLRALMLEKLDAYLSSHTLEAKLPQSIVGSSIVPRSLLETVPNSISIPLSDSPVENGKYHSILSFFFRLISL